MFHLETACRRGEGELLVELGVGEADGGGGFSGVGVDDAFDARPVGGSQAHGAGFAGGVEGAAGDVKMPCCLAGGADGVDFGVGGGVVAADDAVIAFAEDFAVAHDKRAKGAAGTAFAALPRECDGAGEIEGIVIHAGAMA